MLKRKFGDPTAEIGEVKVMAGTKRRPYMSTVNRRLNKLYKVVRAHNPSHLITGSLASIFPVISTTGTLYDLAAGISQGDAPDNRFSSQCILKRLRIKGCLFGGGSATTPAPVRITVFKGQTGLSFANNMTDSYNPIKYGTSLRLIYDKFYTVPQFTSTAGWPLNVDINIKLNHKQKFTGTAAASQTGDSIYVIMQSDRVSGSSLSPNILGVMEVYFDPT